MKRAAMLCALIGCGVPDEIVVDAFAEQGAQVLCQRTRECMRGVYEATYSNAADCERTLTFDLQLFVEFMDELGCDYDAAQAADAVVEIRDMSCEDFYEGDATTETGEIWGDCGSGLDAISP